MVAFRDEFAHDDEFKTDMGRRAKLQTLCDTRWASRSDALFTFLSAFPVVVSSLEDLEAHGDTRARNSICNITKFDFLVTLVVVEKPKSSSINLEPKELAETAWDELIDKAPDLAA